MTGLGIFADGMVEHDGHVGQMLDLLEQLKIADNTVVIYTVDNGPHYNEWPDGGISPFRGEKNTSWEGGYRVPCLVRWPGKIPAGRVSNEIMSMQDWGPTLMAAVGEPGIKQKLMRGHAADGKRFRVHLDGYNLLPHLMGREKESPRKEFFYFSDDGLLVGVRHRQWKLVFAEQRAKTFRIWPEPRSVVVSIIAVVTTGERFVKRAWRTTDSDGVSTCALCSPEGPGRCKRQPPDDVLPVWRAPCWRCSSFLPRYFERIPPPAPSNPAR